MATNRRDAMFQQLTQQLDRAELSELLVELAAYLDEGHDEDAEAAWADELEHRAQDVLDGTTTTVSADEFRRSGEALLAELEAADRR